VIFLSGCCLNEIYHSGGGVSGSEICMFRKRREIEFSVCCEWDFAA
jgi:hypothetical protein